MLETAAMEPSPDSSAPAVRPLRWQRPLVLFLVTTLSVFIAGAQSKLPEGLDPTFLNVLRNSWRGWTFAVPLMAILVTHEFGHYIAARIHRVPASLPFFIPFPWFNPFGTMGAVIAMPERIRSRNALLDIGAAGPIAGMVVAIPVIIVGLMGSEVQPIAESGFLEGQCLLYTLLKYVAVGPIPEGHDVFLSSTAFAGWTGLLITMINLIPVSQLDGGHIAYALLGKSQNKVARVVHLSLLGAVAYNVLEYGEIAPGMPWLVWFGLLFVLRRLSGTNHPPTDPGELSASRKLVAIGCLVLFIVLFMPTPLRAYGM